MPLKNWSDLVADAGDAGKPITLLPDGVYDFVITESSYRQSSTGKDGYNITGEIETGPYKKRKVFNTFYVSPESPSALGMFFRQMSTLGLTSEFFSKNPSNDDIVAALKGKRFRGTVKKSEWGGKERNEIDGVADPNPSIVAAAGGAGISLPTSSSAPSMPSSPAVAATVPSTPSVEEEKTAPATPKDDPWGSSAVPTMPGAPTPPPF